MSTACTSQPLSWLTLERYELDEVAPAERGAVERHLAECPACAAALAALRADPPRRLRPLPAAPPRRAWWRWGGAAAPLRWSLAGAALAAALAVLVLAPPRSGVGPGDGPLPPGPRVVTKGGEHAVTLLRERAGRVSADPRTFAPGDRFKLRLTCPPGPPRAWDVVVFQADGPSFPFPPGGTLTCGNAVPLPGAFRLTLASPTLVCAVASAAAPPDRAALRAPAALPEGAVCAPLLPVR